MINCKSQGAILQNRKTLFFVIRVSQEWILSVKDELLTPKEGKRQK